MTSNELYWDEIFFTADEEPAETRVTTLELMSANLHHRGYSRRLDRPNNAPKHYEYSDLETSPRWPPMRGTFTRFGEVRELLVESDDLMVVMGAGDEMTLRFKVPEGAPPEGWQRDFLLYNVGWDKDADLNTVWGQTVEPLPYRAMRRYPPDSDESYPDSPRHRQYINEYQTRELDWSEFWRHLSE